MATTYKTKLNAKTVENLQGAVVPKTVLHCLRQNSSGSYSYYFSFTDEEFATYYAALLSGTVVSSIHCDTDGNDYEVHSSVVGQSTTNKYINLMIYAQRNSYDSTPTYKYFWVEANYSIN